MSEAVKQIFRCKRCGYEANDIREFTNPSNIVGITDKINIVHICGEPTVRHGDGEWVKREYGIVEFIGQDIIG